MELAIIAFAFVGTLGVLGGAFALGLRHGIDWDHIAAITDITSTTAGAAAPGERWLTNEPGVLLSDESDHMAAELARERPIAGGAIDVAPATSIARRLPRIVLAAEQARAVFLASLYAIGHGTMVVVLGLIALLASGFLPSWIDPVMGRIVGVTLVLLAVYLFYSLYRYFRGNGEFRIRSRWMLIFAGAQNAMHWVWDKVRGEHDHGHVHAHIRGSDQYGPVTAYTVGLVHGVGAETGTQVLIIAAAVGAGSKLMGVSALFAFVAGLLVSNSFVTVATAAGFVSAQRRQLVYVIAGLLAAVFSLVLGLFFLFEAGGFLPALDPYFRWIGGPDA